MKTICRLDKQNKSYVFTRPFESQSRHYVRAHSVHETELCIEFLHLLPNPSLGARASDPARLEEAVAAYRAASEERASARVPLDWATTLGNLGNALRSLDERESDPTRLDEARVAFQSAYYVLV